MFFFFRRLSGCQHHRVNCVLGVYPKINCSRGTFSLHGWCVLGGCRLFSLVQDSRVIFMKRTTVCSFLASCPAAFLLSTCWRRPSSSSQLKMALSQWHNWGRFLLCMWNFRGRIDDFLTWSSLGFLRTIRRISWDSKNILAGRRTKQIAAILFNYFCPAFIRKLNHMWTVPFRQ